ncbi:MAG TPA: MFS transporter [Burkholderiaceae bacterium]|nr:MFS transporter [Burkholderiaceae bacterium]
MFGSLPPFLPALILINLTGHMALSGGRLTGSLFVLANGQPEAMVGLFMAMFSVIPMMTALAIGRWVDRAGSARVMRAGVALILAGAWLPVIWLALPTMLVLAMTLGLGFNILSVAAQHSVGHLDPAATPSRRLANFGWFALGHSASSALGPFIAGLMIDHLGFRAAFAAMALASSVAAVVVATRTGGLPRPQTFPGTPAVPATADPASANPATAAPTLEHRATPAPVLTAPRRPRALDLLSSREMRRIYWVNMMTASGWDLFIVTLPVIGHRLGYSASVIGTVFSLFAVGTFVARAMMPWLSQRASEWQILRVSLVVMVLVFFALPWAVVALMLMALGLVFGCAVGMSQPNMLSLLHTAAPPGRGGEAVGLRSVLSNGCSVAVPLAFGAAVGGLGISALLMAGGLMVGTAIWPAHRGAQARHEDAQGERPA